MSSMKPCSDAGLPIPKSMEDGIKEAAAKKICVGFLRIFVPFQRGEGASGVMVRR